MPRSPRRKNVQSTERNSKRIYPFGETPGKMKPLPDHTRLVPTVETIEEDHTPSRDIQRAYEEYRKENPLSEQDWHHARHEIAFHRYKKGIPLPDEEKTQTLKETIGKGIAAKEPVKIELPTQSHEFTAKLGNNETEAKIAIFPHGKIDVFISNRFLDCHAEIIQFPDGRIEVKENFPAIFSTIFGIGRKEAILKALELAVAREKKKQHQT